MVPGVAPAATSSPVGYSPQQIRHAYGFDQITFGGGIIGDGAGMTIAIVDAYDDPNITSDLHQFDLSFGLPDPVLTKVNQTGGSSMPEANSVWITEIALDVEWAHAIAPKANILLVEASSNSWSDLSAAVDYARHATGVVAVSLSWGSSEFSGETDNDSLFTTPIGHTGVSFVVASGDQGAPTSYPSASPNVLSVGGTSLQINVGGDPNETGWSGSGGGISLYESQPLYQKTTVSQSSTQRTNPDVAYDSDPVTGFPVFDSYNNGTAAPWRQWGGTSAAAPQWSALIAIADQGRALGHQGPLDGKTQLLPGLYQAPANSFHDITDGISTGTPHYSAGSGYDLVTGRGSPNVPTLMSYLVTVTDPINSPPILSGATDVSRVTNQLAVPVSPRLAINDVGHDTLSYATVTIANVVSNEDVLGFVNNNGSQFGNISATYNSSTGQLKLVSAGSQATVAQFQAALRAVTYSNQGSTQTQTSRTVSIQASNGTKLSNVVTSSIRFAEASTTTSVTSSSASAVFGQSVTITATVTVASPGRATNDIHPSGIQFFDGTQLLTGSTTATFSNGVFAVSLTTSNLATGYHLIKAVYSGDSNFVASTSPVLKQTIFHAGTTTNVSSSTAMSLLGQPVTLIAKIGVVQPGSGTPTVGNAATPVAFMEGTTTVTGLVTYSVANGNLIATLTTSGLSAGLHTITASYAGDPTYLASHSSVFSQVVSRASSRTTITSSKPASSFGESIQITAVISGTAAGAAVPTVGTATLVKFMEGTATLPGTVTYQISNGKLIATLTTTSLAAGLHSIVAVYTGDANHLGSSSNSLTQTITRAATKSSVLSSQPTAGYSSPVTFVTTVTAAGSGDVPLVRGANVTFMDGNVTLPGLVTYRIVDGDLVASLITTGLSTGLHTITSRYTGDANFLASPLTSVSQVILRQATNTTVTSSSASATFGQPLTLIATISPVGQSGFPLSVKPGSVPVSFMDGSQIIPGLVTYQVSGGKVIASLTASNLATGSHSITAVYSGDQNFQSSRSNVLSQKIAAASTSVVVSSSIASPVFGQQVTLTAVVDSPSGILALPSGTTKVTFSDGSVVLAGVVSYRIDNRMLIAMLTTSTLPTGIHTIVATYTGDANHRASQSAGLKQTVFHAGTTLTLTSSALSAGNALTLTAVVGVVSPGQGIPTGDSGTENVTFMDGNQLLTGTVRYTVVDGKLVATLTTSLSGKGQHQLTAKYSGDTGFLACKSAAVVVRVD